ncbi:MAG: ATP-binding cassette domain-containing protein [Pseudomonadota bacterium]
MISISDLSHAYGPAPILTDVSLNLPKGGITAIIGPNGAGKSTLLHLIGRILRLQSGRIRVDDLDVATTDPRVLAQKMTLVAQNAAIASRLRVAELVGFGRWPWSRGRLTAADTEIVNDALQTFELQELSDRFLDTLSGGQRQRAHIAMAFAQQTDWMLLDEPLNHLDMAHARSLMETLHGLSQSSALPSPTSIVMVAHDVNYTAAWADRVVAMKDGRVLLQGTPYEVLTPENIRQIYDLDVSKADGGRLVLDYFR